MKQEICFCTFVTEEHYHSMGADKLVRSSKYFHPNIPFIVFTEKTIEVKGIPMNAWHPFIVKDLMNKYTTVVYFDADSMITGKLTELLMAPQEIVLVRNNNDLDKAGKDEPMGQRTAGTEHYVNAGLVLCRSEKFSNEWAEETEKYGDIAAFGCQSILNVIYHKYEHFIVDGKKESVYYGVSCLSGKNTHWDSWKEIQILENELVLNGKKVKVLHQAGGFKPDKLGYYMFNESTRKRLIQICP